MNRRRYILLLLVMASAGCTLLFWPDRGPLYHGRRTADWVEEALKDKGRTAAFEAVLKIGAPAVPFVARGLHDRSHESHFISDDDLMSFALRHQRLARWTGITRLAVEEKCACKHAQAAWILWCLGTNAQAAIPDVIDCLDHCPNIHFGDEAELLDTLGEISGTNTAAIPYLTRRARDAYSPRLRAAATVYRITGQNSLLIETCEHLSREEPGGLLDGPELFWFRDNPELNQHIVPLLEKLYLDPRLDPWERTKAFNALESRTNDPAAALFCRRFPQPKAASIAAH